eukprot:TRINITY_DN10838_c0_g1_i1.p1 TRINITY_DN10838_c0_g1~~TRINITY_DN10838_c0_g1_i1.p1  ORF type:complete len:193 (+),score=13.28 TRINITY_DN10838_c0_g1_i1:108-686(+)
MGDSNQLVDKNQLLKNFVFKRALRCSNTHFVRELREKFGVSKLQVAQYGEMDARRGNGTTIEQLIYRNAPEGFFVRFRPPSESVQAPMPGDIIDNHEVLDVICQNPPVFLTYSNSDNTVYLFMLVGLSLFKRNHRGWLMYQREYLLYTRKSKLLRELWKKRCSLRKLFPRHTQDRLWSFADSKEPLKSLAQS